MAAILVKILQPLGSNSSCSRLVKASIRLHCRSYVPKNRCFCTENADSEEESKRKPIKPSIRSKFSPFSDDNNDIVLDMQEEMMTQDTYHVVDDASDDGKYLYRDTRKTMKSKKLLEMNLSRGKDGVFDLFDLSLALNLEQVTDVVVIKIPPEKRYCDFMVIGTVKNGKHMTGTVEFLKKLYKLKKSPEDPFLNTAHDRQYDHRKSPWQVLDFHNIVLHLFHPDTRNDYDLETLWTVGPEFDDQTVRPPHDPVVDMMKKHMQFIETLEPGSTYTRAQ